MATFWEIAARSVGHMFSLSFAYLYFLFISHLGFTKGVWLLIAPVPVHCFSITIILLSCFTFCKHAHAIYSNISQLKKCSFLDDFFIFSLYLLKTLILGTC